MNPSQVRRRILEEHVQLRRQLDALETAANALSEGRIPLANVTETARGVLTNLVEHTQLEDAIVAPSLRDIDAWGPTRADRLIEHHMQQREQLASIVLTYEESAELSRVARLTLAWIEDVRLDMQHEEREMLNSNLLRDDVISVEMECG